MCRNENHYLSLPTIGTVCQMANFNWKTICVSTSFLGYVQLLGQLHYVIFKVYVFEFAMIFFFVCVFFRYSYMIDNIILLITGTLHQRPITELIPKCHPLGSFEQMEAIHIAATPAELYNAVLVDTPLGG